MSSPDISAVQAEILCAGRAAILAAPGQCETHGELPENVSPAAGVKAPTSAASALTGGEVHDCPLADIPNKHNRKQPLNFAKKFHKVRHRIEMRSVDRWTSDASPHATTG